MLFFRAGGDGDDDVVLVVFSVQISQLDLDGLSLLCADISFAGLISSSLSSLQRLGLRLDIWNVGPSLAGSVGGGDGEFFDQRHPAAELSVGGLSVDGFYQVCRYLGIRSLWWCLCPTAGNTSLQLCTESCAKSACTALLVVFLSATLALLSLSY